MESVYQHTMVDFGYFKFPRIIIILGVPFSLNISYNHSFRAAMEGSDFLARYASHRLLNDTY